MSLFAKLIGDLTSPLTKYEDPRTGGFPLVSTPIPALTIVAFYIFICTFLGPRIMQNRKPFKLKEILVGYNLIQFVASCWLFYQLGVSGWFTGDYSYKCQPIDRSNNPKTLLMNNATWWYFIAKFTELIETIFFIMRKKYSQVNEVHLFHHAIMPLSCWLAIKYFPNGHGTFPGLANSFVHIIMYAYYFLSAFGPKFRKYLWWKKYLTMLQMAQFVVVMVHTLQLIFRSCEFPRIFVWYMSFLALSFYVLFRKFYNRTYDVNKVKNSKEL